MKVFFLLLTLGGLFAQTAWRETEIEGRRVRYQIVDGEAVIGDIILGPAAAFEAEAASGKAGKFSSVIVGTRYRWEGAVVPYIIDDDVPEVARIQSAMRNWSDTTQVRFVARTTENDYVQFRRRNGVSCSSSVGRIGGRQFITLPDDCSIGSIAHEIGHALGLWHTQSRQDRDMFVDVDFSNIDRESANNYRASVLDGEDYGGYPFDSIMHYSLTGFALPSTLAMQTVPRGIATGQRESLAPSDIDAITRLYGQTPRRTTITSNPAGATVFVDGRAVVTPATFDWTPGSAHTLSAEDQEQDTTLLTFGRWSNFGQASQTITANAATTVYTVHFRRMVPFPISSSPVVGGNIILTPAAENGRLPNGTLLELRAEPAPTYAFTNWSGFGYFSTHGSANPIRIPVTTADLRYTASFTQGVVTTITSNPPGLRVVVDGTTQTTPRQYIWVAGTTHTLRVATLAQTSASGASKYQFTKWSNSGENGQTFTATAGPATISADFSAQHRVSTLLSPTAGGSLTVDPPLTADGFANAGTVLTFTAAPRGAYAFSGWGDDLSGTAAAQQITVTRDVFASARFAIPNQLSTSGLVNGASQLTTPLAPGEIVTLYGQEIGPAQAGGVALTAQGRVATVVNNTRVFFNGAPAPLIYVSSGQINCIVPYGVSGQVALRVEVGTRVTNTISVNVQAAVPAFFTYNSSGGGGGAFLNQNGSVNTRDNPASRGDIVVLYATGAGATVPAQADGEVTAGTPPRPALPVKLFIADREAEILFVGSAPGLVSGLTQINARVPREIDTGTMPVVLQVGDFKSPRTVSLAVQ